MYINGVLRLWCLLLLFIFKLLPFSRRIRIVSNRVNSLLKIVQFKIVGHAVGASDHKLGVFLCFLGHSPYAEATDVVFATGTNQDGVVIAQTHRTAVFVDIGLVWVVGVDAFHVVFVD